MVFYSNFGESAAVDRGEMKSISAEKAGRGKGEGAILRKRQKGR